MAGPVHSRRHTYTHGHVHSPPAPGTGRGRGHQCRPDAGTGTLLAIVLVVLLLVGSPEPAVGATTKVITFANTNFVPEVLVSGLETILTTPDSDFELIRETQFTGLVQKIGTLDPDIYLLPMLPYGALYPGECDTKCYFRDFCRDTSAFFRELSTTLASVGDRRNMEFLNAVFSWDLQLPTSDYSGLAFRVDAGVETVGLAATSLPAIVGASEFVSPINKTSLPPGAVVLYEDILKQFAHVWVVSTNNPGSIDGPLVIYFAHGFYTTSAGSDELTTDWKTVLRTLLSSTLTRPQSVITATCALPHTAPPPAPTPSSALLFFDSDFVSTTSSTGVLARNALNSAATATAVTVTTLTTYRIDSFGAALSGHNVFVIPETGTDAIRRFNGLVIAIGASGRVLLNTIFTWSPIGNIDRGTTALSVTADTAALAELGITEAPATIDAVTGVNGVDGRFLPPGVRVLYRTSKDHVAAFYARTPLGAQVIYFGFKFTSESSGWTQFLTALLSGPIDQPALPYTCAQFTSAPTLAPTAPPTPHPPQPIAIFFDANFVDTVTEAKNIRTIVGPGHSTFTNVPTSWTDALSNDFVIIPEMEKTSQLEALMSETTRNQIRSYSGTLIVCSDAASRFVSFLKALFPDWAAVSPLVLDTTSSATSTLDPAAAAVLGLPAAAATALDLPSSIAFAQNTNGVTLASLPKAAVSLYTTPTTATLWAASIKGGPMIINFAHDFTSTSSHWTDVLTAILNTPTLRRPPATVAPTMSPTDAPTNAPTPTTPPTANPTTKPTEMPTLPPSASPTPPPSPPPTTSPTTANPTLPPTTHPTMPKPTAPPSPAPTRMPVMGPVPTAPPSTPTPTMPPTTSTPTNPPTTPSPTKSPTVAPSSAPTTAAPTGTPSQAPSTSSTAHPVLTPTTAPTAFPTRAPTTTTTAAPSRPPWPVPLLASSTAVHLTYLSRWRVETADGRSLWAMTLGASVTSSGSSFSTKTFSSFVPVCARSRPASTTESSYRSVFGWNEAHAACRSLGAGRFARAIDFGTDESMDTLTSPTATLRCTATDTSVADCFHEFQDAGSCAHPAKVICAPPQFTTVSSATLATTMFESPFETADIDGNGQLDIVLANAGTDGELMWFANTDGFGGFAEGVQLDKQASGFRAVHVGDLNNDDHDDVVAVARNVDGVLIFINDGFGQSFTKVTVAKNRKNARAVHVTDVDGDGLRDILLCGRFATLLRNNGGDEPVPTFTEVSLSDAGQECLAITAADVNNDGCVDPIFATVTSWATMVWGDFSSSASPTGCDYSDIYPRQHTIFDRSYNNRDHRTPTVVDIDGDGWLDLIPTFSSSAAKGLFWLRNTGDGVFAEQPLVADLDPGETASGSILTMALVDSDGDGDLDIVAALDGYPTPIVHFEYPGASSLVFARPVTLLETAIPIVCLRMADFDLDTSPDLAFSTGYSFVSANGGLSVAMNGALSDAAADGKKLVFSRDIRGGAGETNVMIAADIDSDGDIDLLLGVDNNNSGEETPIYWVENVGGTASFSAPKPIVTSARNPIAMAVDDLDGSGTQDVVVSFQGAGTSLSWFANAGAAGGLNFSVERPIFEGTNTTFIRGIAIADVNNDGRLDVVVSAYTAASILLFLSTGPGTFAEATVLADQMPLTYRVSVAQVDDDGLVDILATSGNGVVWLKNLDRAQFSAPRSLGAAVGGALAAAPGDVDGDGDIDVVSIGNFDSTVVLFENLDGRGSFSDPRIITTSLPSPLVAIVADADADGDLDIFVASDLGIAVLTNADGKGTFSSVATRAFDVNEAAMAVAADFNSDGVIDIAGAGDISTPGGPFSVNVPFSINLGWKVPLWPAPAPIPFCNAMADTHPVFAVCERCSTFFRTDGSCAGAAHGFLTPDVTQSLTIASLTRNGLIFLDPEAMVFSDLDNDGDMDVVIISEADGQIVAVLNEGDGLGTFAEMVVPLVSWVAPGQSAPDTLRPFAVSAADMNGDGFEDVLVSYGSEDDPKVGVRLAVLVNRALPKGQVPSFHNEITLNCGGSPFKRIDGDPLVVPAAGGGAGVDILLIADEAIRAFRSPIASNGHASSSFNCTPDVLLASSNLYGARLLSGDVDGNGLDDIVVVCGRSADLSADSITWFPRSVGSSGPELGAATEFKIPNDPDLPVSSCHGAVLADFDNDGKLDVAILAESSNSLSRAAYVTWYKNLGGGVFDVSLPVRQIGVVGDNLRPIAMRVLDADGDDALDIAILSRDDGKVALYRNTGGGIFSSQMVITTSLSRGKSLVVADVDGDGDPDLGVIDSTATEVMWFANLHRSSASPRVWSSAQAKSYLLPAAGAWPLTLDFSAISPLGDAVAVSLQVTHVAGFHANSTADERIWTVPGVSSTSFATNLPAGTFKLALVANAGAASTVFELPPVEVVDELPPTLEQCQTNLLRLGLAAGAGVPIDPEPLAATDLADFVARDNSFVAETTFVSSVIGGDVRGQQLALGLYPVTLTVFDVGNNSDACIFDISVLGHSKSFSLNQGSLLDAQLVLTPDGVPRSRYDLAVVGGQPLPVGVSLDAKEGRVIGTPLSAQVRNSTRFRVCDTAVVPNAAAARPGSPACAEFTAAFEVAPFTVEWVVGLGDGGQGRRRDLEWWEGRERRTTGDTVLPRGAVSATYRYSPTGAVVISGGTNCTEYSVVPGSGSLPAGLVLEADGTIAGQPEASGPAFRFQLLARDASSVSAVVGGISHFFSLTVDDCDSAAACNGGTCIDTIPFDGNFACDCEAIGRAGEFCQESAAANADAGGSSSTLVPAIVGAVAGAVVVAFAIALLVVRRRARREAEKQERELEELRRRARREAVDLLPDTEEDLLIRIKAIEVDPVLVAMEKGEGDVESGGTEGGKDKDRSKGELGSGEFGRVVKARLLPGGEALAVKMLKTGVDVEQQERFLVEAYLTAMLEHPHVVRVLALCTRDIPFLVGLEFMPGGNLRDYMRTAVPAGSAAGVGSMLFSTTESRSISDRDSIATSGHGRGGVDVTDRAVGVRKVDLDLGSSTNVDDDADVDVDDDRFIYQTLPARRGTLWNAYDGDGVGSSTGDAGSRSGPDMMTMQGAAGGVGAVGCSASAGLVEVTQGQLLEAARQICSALSFLERKRVVHRDLAARNVLVGHSLAEVKLADFGLSRKLEDKDYYRKTSDDRVPVKWMAPESIQKKVYSNKSDMWSFGVLLWEMYSFGDAPFKDLTAVETALAVGTGRRMGQPQFCPDPVFTYMLKMWSVKPNKRPTFDKLEISTSSRLSISPTRSVNVDMTLYGVQMWINGQLGKMKMRGTDLDPEGCTWNANAAQDGTVAANSAASGSNSAARSLAWSNPPTTVGTHVDGEDTDTDAGIFVFIPRSGTNSSFAVPLETSAAGASPTTPAGFQANPIFAMEETSFGFGEPASADPDSYVDDEIELPNQLQPASPMAASAGSRSPRADWTVEDLDAQVREMQATRDLWANAKLSSEEAQGLLAMAPAGTFVLRRGDAVAPNAAMSSGPAVEMLVSGGGGRRGVHVLDLVVDDDGRPSLALSPHQRFASMDALVQHYSQAPLPLQQPLVLLRPAAASRRVDTASEAVLQSYVDLEGGAAAFDFAPAPALGIVGQK